MRLCIAFVISLSVALGASAEAQPRGKQAMAKPAKPARAKPAPRQSNANRLKPLSTRSAPAPNVGKVYNTSLSRGASSLTPLVVVHIQAATVAAALAKELGPMWGLHEIVLSSGSREVTLHPQGQDIVRDPSLVMGMMSQTNFESALGANPGKLDIKVRGYVRGQPSKTAEIKVGTTSAFSTSSGGSSPF